jgi:PAS domain S-box-containing protein
MSNRIYSQENKKIWSVKSKLILTFSVLFVLVFVMAEMAGFWGIPYTSLSGRRDQKRLEVFQNLNLIADIKKKELLHWLEEKRDDIHVTAATEYTSNTVQDILDALHGHINEGFRGEDLWTRVRKEKSYLSLENYLNTIRASYGIYERFQIADARMGTIFFSTDETDLGSKISQDDHFKQIHNGYSETISDIDVHGERNDPCIHFFHHIIDLEGEIVAVMIMEVDIENVLGPMLHTGEGLGKTGEALLVNKEVKILTSLKHPLADGSNAKPLKYQIQARPAVLAAYGEEGIVETLDYRDEPVLAAYRHIVVSPEVTWGMVVKRDRKELFASLRKDEFFSLTIGLIGIILLLITSIILTGRITRPIEKLSNLASRVTDGDLEVLACVESQDEIGLLAQTFNSMVNKIRNWRNDLENAVAERTNELNVMNKELNKEVADRKHAEKIQSVLLQISESSSTSHDLNELYATIHQQLGRLLYTKNLFVALYDQEKDIYSFPYYIDEFDEADDVLPRQLPSSLTDYVRRTGQPLLVDKDVDRRLREENKVGMVGTPSAIWLGVPLKTPERVIGVLAIQNYTDSSCYSEKDLDLLMFVSGHIAMAIERKRSEDRLKLFQFTIDHSRGSMLWIGSDGSLLHVNDYACRKLGYSKEELLSMTIRDINPNITKKIWSSRWEELREKGSFTIESIHRTKNGREFPVEVSANYLEYDGQEYNFTYTRDITEKKKVDRMKDEFVSIVSHELRTPLTSIHGSIDLIRQEKAGTLPDKAKALLEIACRNSVRLKELIEDLLDIQKLESNKIEFNFKPLELKSLLVTSIENNKSFGEQLNVEFVLDDIIPDIKVSADSSRLKQVMDNLLSNAAKFSPPDGAVGVSITHYNQSVRVSVSDSGPGIPEEFRPKIFQKFTQADSSRTRRKGGTGLGLSIAKSIVEQHGGKIGFETELDAGTTFYFELPELFGSEDS